jgi:hypothetical protein
MSKKLITALIIALKRSVAGIQSCLTLNSANVKHLKAYWFGDLNFKINFESCNITGGITWI